VVPCIAFAAREYHQSVSVAECVAHAESTDHWWADNGSHFGLFQFDWTTWAGTRMAHLGRSVWSALANARGAMQYWAEGQTSRWVTYDGCA
jgi:hypothetical protein